jgi:hypothetical protein
MKNVLENVTDADDALVTAEFCERWRWMGTRSIPIRQQRKPAPY